MTVGGYQNWKLKGLSMTNPILFIKSKKIYIYILIYININIKLILKVE
jgi:hypothetical protein